MSRRQQTATASPEWGLAGVYALTVLARTIVIALIPVMAYSTLGTAQHVSELYFVSSLVGIVASLLLPNLLARVGRWRVFIAAALAGAASAAALSSQTLPGLALGLVLHILMVLSFENVMSLYVLQFVSRRSLSTFESRRVLLSGITYGVGPALGAWLTKFAGPWAPLILSAICAVAVPLVIMRLKPGAESKTSAPPLKGPRRSDVRLFLSQPRLRLAWVLAAIRASWWCMFIVYTPILAVSHGMGASTGGIMIAIGSALLVLAPFWGRVVKRIGMRRLLLGAYVICGFGTIATGLLAAPSPGGAAAMLLFAAFAMSAVDGMGNVPYLRAVRPHQRTDMTPIYNTYRDVAQVAPAGFFAILLAFLPLPSVFFASGVLMVLASAFCLYLPRRF